MRRLLLPWVVLVAALAAVLVPGASVATVGAAPPDRVDAYGTAVDRGSPDLAPGAVAIGIAPGPDGGYWVVTDDGGVQSFGVPFYGSLGAVRLAAPIVGIAAAPDGQGYWLVAADGGVFTFGSAVYAGSLGGTRLAAPIVGIAAAPDGRGYWLVAADGGVFSFGSAHFAGSLGGTRLAAPVVAIASTSDGRGYWLAAADGGVFTFGDAGFFGSAGDYPLQAPITSIVAVPAGTGYWLAGRDGGVFTYGDATFHGAATGGVEPVTAMSAPSATGYWLLRSPTSPYPPLPPDSGSGRRIVYSNPMQRVWLVEADDHVTQSHLVSGRYHVPPVGTYHVYSKSERAYAGHDNIDMDFMVRFADSATSGIPIGFHGIPRRNGVPMQTDDDLGGFRSAGCVRQSEEDAQLVYGWASVGTTVVVLW